MFALFETEQGGSRYDGLFKVWPITSRFLHFQTLANFIFLFDATIVFIQMLASIRKLRGSTKVMVFPVSFVTWVSTLYTALPFQDSLKASGMLTLP